MASQSEVFCCLVLQEPEIVAGVEVMMGGVRNPVDLGCLRLVLANRNEPPNRWIAKGQWILES